MNTVELYVEPILIGALTLALLILPFAPELLVVGFARLEPLKAFSDVALAAVLVGVAYFVGILADRLIDTCMQALERHIAFASRWPAWRFRPGWRRTSLRAGKPPGTRD
jgi:membrane protein YqaA with SNARE-associated domain